MRVAPVVAAVMAKERAHPVMAEVGDAVHAIHGHDGRVGEDDLVGVDAALEIAEEEPPARLGVAEVAEGLQDLAPRGRDVRPSGVAVVLPVVLDEGLD